MNDESGFGTEFIEDLRQRLREGGRKNARELNIRTRRIRKRTRSVEDGALTDLLARTDGMLHRGMKFGGEHKSDANLFNGLRDLFGREFEADTKRRKNIRGATMRGLGTVTMLGNFASGTGEDKCRSSGNIERVCAITA